MVRQCIRCGASFDDRTITDKMMTETEKACCPGCRGQAFHRSKSQRDAGWFHRLIGRLTNR